MQSEQELIELLDEFGVSRTGWAKTISSLLKEIEEGDCYLKVVDGKLQRFVDVTRIKCYYKDLQLFESKQVFNDGRERVRNHDFVGEKIKKNEDLVDAALRALKEELKVACDKKQLIHHPELDSIETYNVKTSYEGLSSIYRYFNFSIIFDEQQYNESGYQEIQTDKTTYFVWEQVKLIIRKDATKILFDLDGVLTDFEKGFLKRWKIRYPKLPFIELEDRNGQNVREDYRRLDNTYEDLINAIFREPDFFSEMPLINGALEALNEAERQGYNVFICTTLLHNPSEMASRMMWLRRTFGEYWAEKVIMTRDKTLVCGNILIDDRPYIAGVINQTFEHIIFDQPYNREEKKKQRIIGWNNWEHVLPTLKFDKNIFPQFKRPIILIDISGTLANTEECYLRKWRQYYKSYPFVPLEKRNQHSIIDQYKELDNSNISYGVLMERMIHEPDIYNTMKLNKGADTVLDDMKEAGYDVYICTRSFKDNANVAGKMQLIQREFGQQWMDRTIIVRDKSMIHADILIDDIPELRGCCTDPNFVHVLFDQPYNRETIKPRITDWSNWKCVIEKVLQEKYGKK